jgi:hypothetical protein
MAVEGLSNLRFDTTWNLLKSQTSPAGIFEAMGVYILFTVSFAVLAALPPVFMKVRRTSLLSLFYLISPWLYLLLSPSLSLVLRVLFSSLVSFLTTLLHTSSSRVYRHYQEEQVFPKFEPL